MSLQNFRLSLDQDDSDFVTALADVGSEQVIVEIARDAIAKRVGNIPTQLGRVSLVQEVLVFFKPLAEKRYAAGDFTRRDCEGDRNVVIRINS